VVLNTFDGGTIRYLDQETRVHLEEDIGILVRRADFDHALLAAATQAGAEARLGEAVLEIVQEGGSVRVTTEAGTYRGRYALVAEGATGKLKHAIRGRDPKRHILFCACANVPADQDGPTRLESKMLLDFGGFTQGYGWVFDQGPFRSVGLGDRMTRLGDLDARARLFFASHGFDPATRRYGHQIPMGGVDRKLGRGRVLLAGDAAGFADAFLGEGIVYAVTSGQTAARAIADHAADRVQSLVDTYASRCKHNFGRELRYSLVLARLLEYAPTWLVRAMFTDRASLMRYLQILQGSRTYVSFTVRLVLRLPWLALKAGGRGLFRVLDRLG
jgi:flavin-dependent dehydrogenase